MGGTVIIGGSMMDMTAARAVGRAQVTVPAGNDNAIEAAMNQFVSKLVSSAGGNARCNASASFYKGLAKIREGPCQVQGTTNIAVAGTSASDKRDLSLGGWEVEFPVANNTRQLSGSKQPDKNTTINYSLTYK